MYHLTNTDYYIIAFLVYTFSFYIAWRFVHIAYSNVGRWSNIKPDSTDFGFTIIPFLNTIFALISIFHSPKRKIYTEKSNPYLKFFKIDE